MSSDSLRYAAIMFAAGIGIPILAVLNAQLGRNIASPAAAATLLFAIAFCVAGLAMVLTTGASPLALLLQQPKYLFLGGALVAFYVLSVTWIAPRFGLGNAIICVLLGQMVSAAIIDHFGLVGAIVRPLSIMRVGGLGLMALGVLLTQWG
jgi:bacterial/archaeal transporter family-2 protein